MSGTVPLLCTTGLLVGQTVALIKSVDMSNHPPEDGGSSQKEATRTFDAKRRWGRIAANQMESVPLALMILWGSWSLTQGSLFSNLAFVGYAVARGWFAYAYLIAHPKRGLGFMVGHLAVILATLYTLAMGSSNSAIPMLSSLALYVLNLVALIKSIEPSNHAPEDDLANKPDLFINTQRKNIELFQRWARVSVNQQEQFPMGLLVLWAALYSNADATYPFIGFAVFRAVYMFGYVNASMVRAVGFIGSMLSILYAMFLGRASSVPVVVTFLLWAANMAALIKTADPNNQPKENTMVTEEMKAEHKAKLAKQGFNRPLRVCVNQLEQFPLALVTLWAAFRVSHGSTLVTGAFAVYAALRMAYAGFYLIGNGPARQMCFGISLMSVLVSASYSVFTSFA